MHTPTSYPLCSDDCGIDKGSSSSLARSATLPKAAPRTTAIPIAQAMSSSSLQVFTMMTASALPMGVLGQVLRDKAAKAGGSGSLPFSPSRRAAAAQQHTECTSTSGGAGLEEPTWTETTTTTTTTTSTSQAARVTQPKLTAPDRPTTKSLPRPGRRRRRRSWIFATRVLPALILGEILRYHVWLGMANREATQVAMLARRGPEPGSTLAFLNVLADVREGDPDWPARCKGDTLPNGCRIQRRADHEEWMRLRQLDPDRGRRFFGMMTVEEEEGALTPHARGEGWWVGVPLIE